MGAIAAKIALILGVYVVGGVAQFVSYLLLAGVRMKLHLDQPISFSPRPRGLFDRDVGVIESHTAGENAIFGALFTSPLSWLGVLVMILGAVFTVLDIVRRCREMTSKDI